jgi:hypothetical protein
MGVSHIAGPLLAAAALALSQAAVAATATRVELSTVGPDFAAWVVDTDAAAAVVVTIDDGSGQRAAIVDTARDRFHYARIDGLAPGVEHSCAVTVDGVDIPPGLRSPATFVTLALPPGEPVFVFATVTDTHVGEAVAGLIGGMDYEGFSWPDPESPYWRFTNEATAAEIAASGVEFVIHKGDLTTEAAAQDVATGKAIYDSMGLSWWPLRGNHDRPHGGVDAFKEALGFAKTWRAFDAHGHRFLLLDSSDVDGNPLMDEAQIAWVEAELKEAGAAKLPTWLVLHHAVSEDAGPLYSLWGEGRDRVLAAIAAASPSVLGVLSGHSHRNVRLESPTAPGVPFVETASPKEYPGMWTEVRVYDGAWMQIAHVVDCPDCREWYSITTGEYGGSAPDMQMGRLEDRCFVVPIDHSLVPGGVEAADGDDAGDEAGPDPEDNAVPDAAAAEVVPDTVAAEVADYIEATETVSDTVVTDAAGQTGCAASASQWTWSPLLALWAVASVVLRGLPRARRRKHA